MRRWVLAVAVVLMAGAGGAGAAGDPPVFVGWMDPSRPLDRAILAYWDRAGSGAASPEELVDLGTMLFERGFPKDAVRIFRRAAKAAGPGEVAAEAWFRSGVVHHRQGDLRRARRAYRRALRLFPGHGWCNFYLALCEEQLGHVAAALHHYRRAYRFAPVLADPKVNPEVLYSRLQAGVVVRHVRERAFAMRAPLAPLEPERVAAARGEPETPEPPEVPPPVTAPRSPAPPAAQTPVPRVEIVAPQDSEVPSSGAREAAPPPPPKEGRRRPSVRIPPGSGALAGTAGAAPGAARKVGVHAGAPPPGPAPTPTPAPGGGG